MSEEGGQKKRGVSMPSGQHPSAPPPPSDYYYGTFQGVANYRPPPQPVIGFPQSMSPAGFAGGASQYYQHGYQTVPGYAVDTERSFREERLPCCGIGVGWFLFISGFFLGAIPWYIGTLLLLCARLEHREKAGLVACTLAAILVSIAVPLSVTRATDSW